MNVNHLQTNNIWEILKPSRLRPFPQAIYSSSKVNYIGITHATSTITTINAVTVTIDNNYFCVFIHTMIYVTLCGITYFNLRQGGYIFGSVG